MIAGLAAFPFLLLVGLGPALLVPGPAGRVRRLAWAALLGPLLVGLFTCAAEFGGARAQEPWLLGGAALLSPALGWATARRRARRGAAAVAAEPAVPWNTVAWIGVAFVLVVFVPMVARPWLRERADSWLHASIVTEMMTHGLPPEDPYFAGFRLQYMWFYHTILLGLTRVPGVDPFHAMPGLNALALFALIVLVADLSAAAGRGGRAAVRAALIVPLGLGVLFWCFFPLRAARGLGGRTGGAEALAALFRLAPLDITTTRSFLSDFDSQPFFLNKFLVGTAYAPALALLMAYLAAVMRFAATRRGAYLALAAVWLWPLLLLHPVVGLTALGVSGLTGVALFLLGPVRSGGWRPAPLLGWGVAVLGAAALAWPYLHEVTRAKVRSQLVPFGFSPGVLAGLLAGALFALLAGGAALTRLWRENTAPGRFLVVWSGMTLLFAAAVRLPGPNSADKFAFLVYLVPAVAAGWWVAERWHGTRGALLLALLLLPANLIGYAGYWCDGDPRRPSTDRGLLWTWLRERTPPHAVVIEARERVEAPVRAARRLYFGRASYAEQWGYARVPMAERRAALIHLYAAADKMDVELVLPVLQRLGRPLYVIYQSDDFTSPLAFHKLDNYPESFERVFERPSLLVYRVR